jgi:valyl-tRNA synthetase
MIEKTFQHQIVEQKLIKEWEESGLFKSGRKKDAEPYTIMMPPANVTGNLHLGHALTFTLQDILIRHYRMRGRDVLWQPGTDHAGIATQMVVERQLEQEGLNRKDLGREKFLERVWEWKNKSGGAIINQLKRLGASADWERERFTMDPHFDACVKKTFVQLYNDGLIYRDKRLVNWDSHYQTAISDLEVEQKETEGHFYYLRYPIENSDFSITIGTTRPETFFGDMAVAVHPEDERYQHLIGKNIILPLVNRKIPIIADSYSDPEKGTGAVKITPAHDFNDFEVGKRHQLPFLSILDTQARLNENTPKEYQGLTVLDARKKVVKQLEENGFIERIEPHKHMVPYGDRSGVVVEPFLTDQWYVDAEKLAGPAIKAVKKGKTSFIPKRWEKTYFDWLNNIQPWCISRQLWWGHQIPAWYGPDQTVFVAETEVDAQKKAQEHYGKNVELQQDSDVLDTWFSSGLWPFVTLDWPSKNDFLERHYPGNVLVTGFDIIFFWVARMMMLSLYFKKDIPFKDVYIHALIRDAKGQKMSKSKGNVIDPLMLIDTYGSDVVRFSLASLASPGKDIKISEDRIAGMRNFSTKLWNVARFILMNNSRVDRTFGPMQSRAPANQWIVLEISYLVRDVTALIEEYKFNEAAQRIYHFAWGKFCDWYIEFTKPLLAQDDPETLWETRGCLSWCFKEVLHLLHPFMPFITEEIWRAIGGEGLLCGKSWPQPLGTSNPESHDLMETVIDFITEIRSVRSTLNIPASQKLKVFVYELSKRFKKQLKPNEEILVRLARLESIKFSEKEAPKISATGGSIQLLLKGMVIQIPLKGIVKIAQEKQRLNKEMDQLELDIKSTKERLENPEFQAKAPEHIIEEIEQRLKDFEEKRTKLKKAIETL